MTLFSLFLLISCSCNNNPLDKKFADTNYIEVLDELQQKNLITEEEHAQMKKNSNNYIDQFWEINTSRKYYTYRVWRTI